MFILLFLFFTLVQPKVSPVTFAIFCIKSGMFSVCPCLTIPKQEVNSAPSNKIHHPIYIQSIITGIAANAP